VRGRGRRRYAATLGDDMRTTHTIVRGLLGALIGTLGGAVAGGLTFGLDASMYAGSSWLGPARDWWPLAAMFGVAGGAGVGLILGLCIVLDGSRRKAGLIAGGVVGLLGVGAMRLLEDDVSWQLRTLTSHLLPYLLSLICWTLIGLAVSETTSKLFASRGQ
jgi:hypothetical protein